MVKRKKSNLSEMISKKNEVKKNLNPFEIHVNRQKFNVLNRKMKADRGLPGVAKAKALKKRKETLLQEYKLINKGNKFIDRRIGERNSAMTKEDRIVAMYHAQMKSQKRKDIFQLADEDLINEDQSIANIEKLDALTDDSDMKGLDAKFVEEASFGGGLLSESKNNRASVIEQLIAESKKRKAERQLAKEKTLQKTEELDAEWKELIPIVNLGKPIEEVEKKDSYDLILNDLKFEPRGTPSDKLKTEVEIAEEESRKLKELEEERLRRMRGEDPTDINLKTQHRSADDLDDCFDLDEDNFELTYDQDGNAVNIDKVKILERRVDSGNSDIESEEEEEEEEEEESDEENDSDNEQMKCVSDIENENGKKVEDDDDDSDSDDLSDLQVTEKKVDENDSEAEDELPLILVNDENLPLKVSTEEDIDSKKLEKSPQRIIENKENKQKVKEKKKVSFGKELILEFEDKTIAKKTLEEIEKIKEDKRLQMEAARKELPYTFEVPCIYEELQELFKGRTFSEQAVILERVIKCNHPTLHDKNKEKLENLFALLMQHLNDSDFSESWSLLDHLAPYLFDLAQFSPGNTAYCLSEVLLEKHSEYLKNMKKFPTPETLVFLKLIPLLFPTSDKRHPVTTPAFIFISEMLGHCHVTTRRAIATGLFLVSICLEYVSLSKRIMPEALNFLCGVIHLATPSTSLLLIPPFKKEHKFLFLHKSFSDLNDINLIMQGSDLVPKPGCKIDDNFRIKAIYCALKLIEYFVQIYQDLPACSLLFDTIKKHLGALEVNKYPITIQKTCGQLIGILEEIMKKELEPLVMEAKKPKALRLYEPSIQPVYDTKKKNLPPEKDEHTKLLHRYRKEMKGALREIRRDRQFISKVKFKEQCASDAERKRKVKEIYAWGAEQQSEFNKLKRKKK